MTPATSGATHGPGTGAGRCRWDRTRHRGGGNRHTGPMGFNPHRQYRRTTSDYVMVGAAVLVCVALVAWAFLG